MNVPKKRQLENDENADPDQDMNAEQDKEDGRLNGVLPLTRVKRLIKMSSTTQTNVSAGAAKLIQLCAEEYLRAFVRTARIYTEQAGRKTIQPKDLTRVIKDDWAFALLEDTLHDWPNDKQQPKLKLTTTSTHNDTDTLFFRNNEGTLPEPPDTQLTDRDLPQIDDDFADARSECQTELNETTDIFPPDSLEVFVIGKPTPKPTMEYLHPQDSESCKLSIPLTYEDTPSDDEAFYQSLLSDKDVEDQVDNERPHNSRFMNSRRVDEPDEDPEEIEDDDESVTSPDQSPRDFDDIEDGFF